MGDTEVTVWLNTHRMEALEKQLELEGSSVEKYMQDYLIDLYAEMVPADEQKRIDDTIAAEQKAEEEVREAQRKFSVFRIVENGEEVFLSADGSADMLSTASTLRAYIKNFPNKPGLQNIIPRSQTITEQQFQAAVEERQDNTGRVVGAYEIDLDKSEFTALHIMDGWKVFQIKDICTAASRAMRKDHLSWDDRWERFLSALDGKELTGASIAQEVKGPRRLQPEEMCFQDEVIECEGKLNFYMPVIFNARKVFGPQMDDLESVNVYASYDIAKQRTDTALEIVGLTAEVEDIHYRYLLTKSERQVLTEKMEDYCQQQYGQSLVELSQEPREELSDPQFGSM